MDVTDSQTAQKDEENQTPEQETGENQMPKQKAEENQMGQEKKVDENRYCNINWNYVPIKAHYFFLFGGMGGTLPYMQVLAKDFGITATAVGIIYTIVPLCVCLAKPTFGFITDKLRDLKAVLMVLLAITALSFFAVLYLPPIKDSKVASVELVATCKGRGDELVITPPKYDPSCAQEITDREFECELESGSCLQNRTYSGLLNVTSLVVKDGVRSPLTFTYRLEKNFIHKPDCDCLAQNSAALTCERNFYKCESFSSKAPSEYAMYSFWAFVVLAVVSGAGTATLFCLTDAACYEILSSEPREYGKQRLWATISWGVATLASGYLNDVATGDSKDRDYAPGFYLMLAFVAVDLIILCQLRLKKANISSNICRDIKSIFSTWKTVVFSIGVYICGALTGLLWTYQFWFLTELGANQLLLGLVAGVQCLIAEVPFFFFSGWFVKKFGHFWCLIASLCAFALRIGLYSMLENPWLVLPIDLLHGVTYAIFCAAMTLYAIDFAAPGTEATMLGILGGIYEGLGVATGSFLGGIGFDNMGGRWTFFIASMASLCSALVFTIMYKILPASEGTMDLDWDSTIYSNDIPYYGSNDPVVPTQLQKSDPEFPK